MTNVAQFREKISTVSLDAEAARDLLNKVLDYSQNLETKLWLLERRMHSPKSERYLDPRQAELFNEAEQIVDSASVEEGTHPLLDDEPEETTNVSGHRRKKRRSQIELAAHLPRETIVHELAPDERLCPCCKDVMPEIGEDVSEKLKVVPAKATVERNVMKKYACQNKSCDSSPVQSPRPETAIPKIKATAETLSFIAVQKYLFSVPLYRLEYLFKNAGVELSRYVMSLWMMKLADVLKPLYLSLEELILARDYLHMDETTLQVLREPDRAAAAKSYVWVRSGGVHGGDPPVVLYHYSQSRSSEVAKTLLGEFRGTLQTDDYSGYGCALKTLSGVKHLLCWDHTRRYFWDAFQQISKEKRANTTADQALKLIGKLYKIEARAKDFSAAKRKELRQKEAIPILQKLKRLCDDKRPNLGDKTLTAVAIDYMTDNWPKLLLYTEDGLANISNSPAEQAVRPFAVGRRNWLFACTPRGAEASAILYSLLQTAKLNGLDPIAYLTSALKGIAVAKTADDLTRLLPLKERLVH